MQRVHGGSTARVVWVILGTAVLGSYRIINTDLMEAIYIVWMESFV